MKHCAACGSRAIKLRTAIVLRGPKSARPGRVCNDCADLGWLFVVGDDSPRPKSNGETKPRVRETKAPKGETMTVKWGLGLREVPRAASPAPSSAPSSLAVGERKVLIAVAQTAGGVERSQLTILTGYKKSTRDLYVQRLYAKELIEIHDGKLWPTAAGTAALGDDFEPLPTGKALLTHWLGTLRGGERAILAYLTTSRVNVIVRRDALSEATGFKKSTRDLYIQRLTARRLIVNHGAQGVQASAELFDNGRST